MQKLWKYILTFCVTSLFLCMILIKLNPTSDVREAQISDIHSTEPQIEGYKNANINQIPSNHGVWISPSAKLESVQDFKKSNYKHETVAELMKSAQTNKLTVQQQLDGLWKYLDPMWNEMETTATRFLEAPPLQPHVGDRKRISELKQKEFFNTIQQYPDAAKLIKFEARPSDIVLYLINKAYPITRDVCNFTGEGMLRRGPTFKQPVDKRFKPCQTDKAKGLCKETPNWLANDLHDNNMKLWSYVVMVRDGCVTSTGDYYSHEFRVLIKKCRQPRSPSNIKEPSFDEIFTFAQYWGYGFGHFLTEDLPRLAPYVEFLRKHTHIKIHAPSTSGFVKAWIGELGLDPDRVISGFHCARVLYAPEGSNCGGSSEFYTQLLSLYIREDLTPVAPSERRNIVFIERTKSRTMRNRKAMHASLQAIAKPYNLTVRLFSDRHLPPLKEAKQIFNSAFMIFTNHGAGEGNMILAPPGTLVFECTLYSGNANGSFHKYSYVVGHRLFTYISQDCTFIKADMLMEHMKEYLPMRENIVTDTCPYDGR